MNAEDRLSSIIDAVSAFRKKTPLSDDISLITFIASPRQLQRSFGAKIENLEAMTEAVSNSCAAYGADFAYAMELAASELFTNVILHSHGDYSGDLALKLLLEPDRVELDLYDTAPSYTGDIRQEPDKDLLTEGGPRTQNNQETFRRIYPRGNQPQRKSLAYLKKEKT